MLGAMAIARVALALQRGNESFDFVQEIAVGQQLDQFFTVKLAMAVAHRALHRGTLVRHFGFLGGIQRSGTPVNRRLHPYSRNPAVTLTTCRGEVSHRRVCGEVTTAAFPASGPRSI